MTISIDAALAGNPNSGKTTLFNRLTGARQHVGNYPGVTVEKKEGRCRYQDKELILTDLPGTYSLTAYTEEEVVARDFLIDNRPRVINITDASNLERNLYLTLQLLEIGVPVIIALNMMDVAKQRGIQIDADKLSLRLGIPVVPIIARSGKGSAELLEEAAKDVDLYEIKALSLSYGEDIDRALDEMEAIIRDKGLLTEKYPARWMALKFLETDQQIIGKSRKENNDATEVLMAIAEKVEKHLLVTLDTHPEAMIADYRYGYIKSLLQDGVVTRSYDRDRLYITDKIDAVLTNRFFGPVIMLAILFGLYKFTFTYSELPVGWFESFFGWLSDLAAATLPDGYVKSLVVSGVIDGVGGVLGFVPIIAFMFLGIAVLEDSGYLARVAYMMDRVLRVFGLHGSSVMAYIVSGGIAGGCAVPGVMAARTLRSRNERLATILTAPFMNCGAKLPVLALLIAAFFQDGQSQMMFILTLVAWIGAVLVAKLLRVTIIKGESTPFVMELPPYRLPTFRGLLIHTWERTWQYIKKAGTVILAISVLIWAMMTFPELPL
nr:ferrous iron transport protein B [Candidatus Desulfobia pelagia]